MDKHDAATLSVRAALDRFGELMADVATVVARYDRELRAKGLPSEQAFQLTRDFQTDYLEHLFDRMREPKGGA